MLPLADFTHSRFEISAFFLVRRRPREAGLKEQHFKIKGDMRY